MMFEYTLSNIDVNGAIFTMVSDKFFEPGSIIKYLGMSCRVNDIEPFNAVSCSELTFSNSCYKSYGFY